MTYSNSRITSFFSVSSGSFRLLAILALGCIFFFLRAGITHAAPVQTNPLQAEKAVSGLKKHGEETKKSSIMGKKAHDKYRSAKVKSAVKKGKDRKIVSVKDSRAKHRSPGIASGKDREKGRRDRITASTGKAGGKKEKKISKGRIKKPAGELSRASATKQKRKASSRGSKRYDTMIALGKNYRTQVHAGSRDDSIPPSASQKDAFEKHLLMEEPLDEQTLNIIESAYSYMGTPYQWGGTTPDGFDCSGFVRHVFRENGISLSRSSREQVQEGKAVPLSELRPGDLVFFKFYSSRNRERNKGRVNHVGLYLGNGQFIHAASNSKNRAITVNDLGSRKYLSRIVEVRRVLEMSEERILETSEDLNEGRTPQVSDISRVISSTR
jgi:cell wall-associated NlpC family hydrolase